MATLDKKELEARMIEKAREYLNLVREYIPSGGHASMVVFPDYISVDIYNARGSGEQDPRKVHVWVDPRETPMEIHA